MNKLLRRASVRIFSLVFAGFFLYTIFRLVSIFLPPGIMKVQLQLTQAQRMTDRPASAGITIPLTYSSGNKAIDTKDLNVEAVHVEQVSATVSAQSFQARLAIVFPQVLWGLICSFSSLQLYLFLKEIRGNTSFSQKQTDRLRHTGICMLAYAGLQYLCQSLLTPTLIVNMEQTRWPSEFMIAMVKKEDYYLWLLGGIVFIYLSIAFKRGELMEEEQKYIL